ncbi:transposase [Klebsiella pneumoniae]|nr:transposase [Klebsiella pneumoniae]
MAKPKYSPETKLAVVNHYLSGKDGEQSTADLFGWTAPQKLDTQLSKVQFYG